MGNHKNNLSITCPSCDFEIEVDDLLRTQIRNQLESELESKIKKEKRDLAKIRKQLESEQTDLKKSQEDFDNAVSAELAKQKSEIESRALAKAREKLEVELDDNQAQIDEMSKQLAKFKQSELDLLKQKRDLENEKTELKLQAAREVNAIRDELIENAKNQFAQEFDMKLAEKDKQISDLRKKADDLKRKAEQGSQQLQGEVQEVALEKLLENSFRRDAIDPVPKGVNGADAMQRVFNSSGHECNSILWESKRTKNWSNGWFEKLRDDQRKAKAVFAVLVSEALPPGISTFGLIDGIWVCSWSCVVPLATALRIGIIDTAKANLAAEGQSEKKELVYQYLAGQEFQQRMAANVEAFVSLQTDMEKEKRSMNSIWSRRGKQLERAIGSASGLYGDLQGIVGASLPTIPDLDLKKIEGSSAGNDDNQQLSA